MKIVGIGKQFYVLKIMQENNLMFESIFEIYEDIFGFNFDRLDFVSEDIESIKVVENQL